MSTRRAGTTAALTTATFALSFAFSYGPDALSMSLPAALAISLAATGTVWLSGPRPVAALAAVVALAAALPVIRSTFEVMDLVVVLVVHRAAAASALRPWVLVTASLGALTVTDVWQRVAFDRGFATPSVLYPAVLTALAVGLGLQSRQLRAQHAELVALREADRRHAVSAERRRIARDLHDVAAHHLTALVVRTKLAGRVRTVPALEEAVAFAARTGGEALDSLRQVVRVLATEPDAPLTPTPTPAELPAVVRRMAAAGLRIEHGGLDVSGVPPEVGVAATRIVQEALANVLRHRGPGRAWLDVRRVAGQVEVTVEDDGPSPGPPPGPAAGSASGPAAGLPPGAAAGPASYGLVGMRERAEACGGRLTVGRSPRGGWRVSAVLPATGA